MNTTECQKLVANYAEKRKNGLLDVKFFLLNTDEALKEELCAEVNRLDDALDRGDYVELIFHDKHPVA